MFRCLAFLSVFLFLDCALRHCEWDVSCSLILYLGIDVDFFEKLDTREYLLH